jgi:hypothetical protein
MVQKPTVGVGGQITAQQAEHPEGNQHPAVGAILALAAAQVGLGEEPEAGENERRDGNDEQRQMREERRKPAPPEDRKPDIGDGPGEGKDCHPGRHLHRRDAIQSS